MSITPELYEAIVRIVDQRVSEVKVMREDFDKLTKVVSELSTTLTRLEEVVERLAEAQKRTEDSLGKLTERVTRLEEVVERLAEAQKRTEDSLGKLTTAVGGLSDTIGYSLEDIAKVMLPSWLEKHERIRVEELERRFIKVNGEEIEVNLYGEGKKGRSSVIIIGEVKSRIHGRDVKEFSDSFNKIKKALKTQKVIPLMFGYLVHPSAASLGKELGIRLIASYQR